MNTAAPSTTSTTSTGSADVVTRRVIIHEDTVPAILPFGKSVGRPIRRIDQVTRLYSTGDHMVTFRCTDCGREFDTFYSTFSHLNAHSTKPRRSTSKAKRTGIEALDRILEETSVLRQKVKSLQRRLDAETKRRKAAEARLRIIDQAFGSR